MREPEDSAARPKWSSVHSRALRSDFLPKEFGFFADIYREVIPDPRGNFPSCGRSQRRSIHLVTDRLTSRAPLTRGKYRTERCLSAASSKRREERGISPMIAMTLLVIFPCAVVPPNVTVASPHARRHVGECMAETAQSLRVSSDVVSAGAYGFCSCGPRD